MYNIKAIHRSKPMPLYESRQNHSISAAFYWVLHTFAEQETKSIVSTQNNESKRASLASYSFSLGE